MQKYACCQPPCRHWMAPSAGRPPLLSPLCAWRPEQLGAMLREAQPWAQRTPDPHPLNRAACVEAVVDRAAFAAHLPDSIEAFFFTASDAGCAALLGGWIEEHALGPPQCESFARVVHSRFVAHFGTATVPLLRLDPTNLEAPFSSA